MFEEFNLMTNILMFILVFFIWCTLDFYFGRKFHLKKVLKRHYPIRHGKWLLFTDGGDLFKNLFKDISNAKHHVHILFYIVKNDHVSLEFLDLLKKKAKEGVTVRLLLDRIGSYRISRKIIHSLKKSGIHVSFCNKPKFPFLFYSLNYRNHRKITVIDGTIGYFGGFNIGREYLGQDPYLGYWQDYHLKLVGDGVQDLQTEFLWDWKRATGEDLLKKKIYFPELSKGALPMRFLPTDGAHLKEFLVHLLNNAKTEILIGTPYFIPGKEILQVLVAALKRGVRVTILVPYKADHVLVREAAFPYFRQLLKAGGRIYRYTNGFYHGKIILIDNEYCDFGTANFDKRSLFINDELNCIIRDPIFIKKIRRELVNDILLRSEQLTLAEYKKRPFWHRGKEIVSSLISDLL